MKREELREELKIHRYEHKQEQTRRTMRMLGLCVVVAAVIFGLFAIVVRALDGNI